MAWMIVLSPMLRLLLQMLGLRVRAAAQEKER
jgi:hypothetical protein